MKEAEVTLRALFSRALHIRNDEPVNRFAYGKTEKWDSLAHVVMMDELEKQFDISLDTDDMLSLLNYDAIVMLLRERGIDI